MALAVIEEYDEASALESVDEDWERDRQGGDLITRAHFCDGLFEYVHLYCRLSNCLLHHSAIHLGASYSLIIHL